LARPAFNIVKNALLTHEHVVLLSYSQGTIISSYIVRKILKDPELRKHAHKLEIYCLAGVADSLHIDYQLTADHGHPVPYVEHFANGQDFFARIGVLSHYYATSGAVFVKPEKRGHMLTDHYIPGLEPTDVAFGRVAFWLSHSFVTLAPAIAGVFHCDVIYRLSRDKIPLNNRGAVAPVCMNHVRNEGVMQLNSELHTLASPDKISHVAERFLAARTISIDVRATTVRDAPVSANMWAVWNPPTRTILDRRG
jgi:hypothetical protein